MTSSSRSPFATLYRRLIHEAANQGRLASLDQLVSARFVEHADTPPSPGGGREALRAFFGQMRRGIPDLRVVVDDLVVAGDTVAARTTWTGTHRGELMGIPATGKPITFQAMDFMRYRGRMAVEHWSIIDRTSIPLQLGFPPSRNLTIPRRPGKARLAARARPPVPSARTRAPARPAAAPLPRSQPVVRSVRRISRVKTLRAR